MKKLTQTFLFLLLVILTLFVSPKESHASNEYGSSEMMITVTCPSSGPIFTQCFSTSSTDGYPPIASSHTDQLSSPNDISDFIAIDAMSNITGTPVGDIIIMAFDLDDTAQGFIGCPGSIINVTRRYEIYDDIDGDGPEDSEMVALCLVNYLINDNTSPTFTLPTDITIEIDNTCSFDSSVAITGDITDEDDNCSSNLEATFSDDLSGLTSCNNTGVILRTWSLVDDCGNAAANQTQMITVIDNTTPTAVCQNISVTLDSNGEVSIDPADLDGGSTGTACGGPLSFSINGSTGPYTLFCNNSTQTNTVTLTVTNDCGASSTCQSQITVLDDTDPTLSCPADLMTDCIENEPPYTDFNAFTAAQGMFMDNCSPDPNSFSLMSETSSGSCPGPVSYTRTYIISDIAGNTATCSQMITVEDNTPPIIIAPTDLSLSCSDDVPVPATTMTEYNALPGASVSDNCVGMISITSSDDPLFTSFTQTTSVIRTYVATDICGNSASTTQTLQFIDDEAPMLSCDDAIVAIGGAGTGYVHAFEVGTATDNCDHTPTLTITRTDIPGTSGPEANFTCGDIIISPITVIVTATDDTGNTSTCMASVTVEDNIPPIIASNCLPSVTVDCQTLLDTADLSAFGTVVFDMADVQDIVVNGMVIGQDALATDNCNGLTLSESIEGYDDLVCNQGTFTRVLTVTDLQGLTASCSQSITIEDADPFDENDITWPANFDLDDCMNVNADTTITGGPRFSNNLCTQVSATFSDLVFDHPNTGCAIIQRDWEVMDWCQFEANANPPVGIFFHTQYITVVNTVAPTFDMGICTDQIVCANELTCMGELNITATATDDCTDTDDLLWSYSLDLFGAGSTVFDGTSNTITGTYPMGDHTVTWVVEDRCGNSNSCSYTLSISDCKEPDVICYHGLSTSVIDMAAGPMVMLSIDKFIKDAFDNCSIQEELTYSFFPNVVRTDTIFDCCTLGQREIEIYVTDAAGNQAYCSTYLNVDDHDGICQPCNNTTTAMIQGKITNEAGNSLSDVEVNISYLADTSIQITDDQGGYSFANLEMYQQYELKANDDSDPLDGITTLDLVLIQKHILGLKTLDSPYKVIAADINNSKSITAIDLIELRKLILGVTSDFSHNESWRFVDKNHVFDNTTQPWPFQENMVYADLDQDMMDSDFIGIKTGDVNLSHSQLKNTSPTAKSNFKGINLKVTQQDVKADQMIKIPLLVEDFDDIVGFQFELAYNIDLLEYRGMSTGSIALGSENIKSSKNGSILISWNDAQSIDLLSGDKLVELIFLTKKEGNTAKAFALLDKNLKAQSYNHALAIGGIEISTITAEEKTFSLGQNIPNPFNQKTAIPFTLPKECTASLIIYDASGQLIFTDRASFPAGDNEWLVDKTQLGVDAGVLYYKLKAGKDSATKKMIIVE